MSDRNVLYDMDPDRLSKDDKKKLEKKILYSNVDESKLSSRKLGEDFKGTMREFQLTFEWVWESPEEKRLHEKESPDFGSSQGRFTGWIHIKDSNLSPTTYPNQQQKIQIEEGLIKLVKEQQE
jgi:hypothetical protein